jgi:molecular chaperone HtpG
MGRLATVDAEHRQLMIEDNGIGMSREELIESLGTIARSGTKAFIDRLEAAKSEEETALIGRFGVGFYSAFMVAEKVEVFSRRAGSETAHVWSSDGKGAFAMAAAEAAYSPRRGTRVVLHLMADAKSYTERATIEGLVHAQSGHVPVPIAIVEKPRAELAEITDGAALWAKPKSSITHADYTDFYRSCRPVRWARAHDSFSRRRPARLYVVVLRARVPAYRVLEPRPLPRHNWTPGLFIGARTLTWRG